MHQILLLTFSSQTAMLLLNIGKPLTLQVNILKCITNHSIKLPDSSIFCSSSYFEQHTWKKQSIIFPLALPDCYFLSWAAQLYADFNTTPTPLNVFRNRFYYQDKPLNFELNKTKLMIGLRSVKWFVKLLNNSEISVLSN